MVELQLFFNELSKLYNLNELEKVPALFSEWLGFCDAENDKGSRVTVLNEMMGFYREKSMHEKAIECAEEATKIMKDLKMEGTEPYAMTLLNAATVYRAAGKYEESAARYAEVFQIFDIILQPGDFRFAEVCNNVSLLYQELGRFDKAVNALERALSICRDTPHKEFETAVTLANLGNCEIMVGELGAAKVDLTEAVEIFTDEGASDTHHAAAITGLADIDLKMGDYEKARDGYKYAMDMIEGYIGQNDDYRRVEEKYKSIPDIGSKVEKVVEQGYGMKLSKDFYEKYGRQMIEDKFPEYAGRIAVGKVGSGSECFGFDDDLSRDHDFGPGFSMWLTDEDYGKISEALSKEYDKILEEYISGKENIRSAYRNKKAEKRNGVRKISDFYLEHTGYPEGPLSERDYLSAEETGLAAAVNGEVFRDDLGEFTAIRNRLKMHYPEYIRLLKVAEYTTMLGREAQYNFERVSNRGDYTAAALMRDSAVRDALHLIYLLNDTYAPHEKWLRRGIEDLPHISYVGGLIDDIELSDIRDKDKIVRYFEKLTFTILREIKDQGIVWGNSTFLPDYAGNFERKAGLYTMSIEKLAEEVAKVEFRAFNDVNNEGGRASCQNNWPTFRIMRMSQYLTWTKEMLIQYITDFEGVISEGRNMITEKYGYMMETTAPEEFKRIKDKLPPVPERKRNLVKELTKIETAWMEEFAGKYPKLSKNARVIHTTEDAGFETSSETYQRGELYSYSDKMLVMYGRFITELCKNNINLTLKIMENTVKMYGYKDLDDAEEKMN